MSMTIISSASARQWRCEREFPFAITPDIMPNPALMRVSGHSFSFVHPLKGDERNAFLISGFGTSPSDYEVDVKDTKTGAGVWVTGDDRLVRLYTWSSAR